MSDEEQKIEDTAEAWEQRALGAEEEFVAVAEADEDAIDRAVGLQMISIRLPRQLIDDYKMLAEIEGMGYQPLMRQVLVRFMEGEHRRIANKALAEMKRQMEAEARAEARKAPKKRKRA